MSKLLHISASPRGEHSESLALASSFLSGLEATAAHTDVEHWDLWDGTLPSFGPSAAEAKMAVFAGTQPTGAAAAAWDAARAAFERFTAADQYLFSIPMWNHTVPYIVKQFIDVVSQPGMLFGFDPEAGYTGLVTGKRAAVIYTGAVWGPGRPESFGEDHLTPYFEAWLRWAGIEDIASVRFQPNLVVPDADARRAAAHAEATALGRGFAEARAA